MGIYLALFGAGILTILLPCILPLLPIVLGVSIAGRNPLRPLFLVLGMVISFVGFTLLLNAVLAQFVELADIIRISTQYVLLLFGAAFLFRERLARQLLAVAGSLFFITKGLPTVAVAAVLGIVALEAAGWVSNKIQQAGAEVQQQTRSVLGESPLAALFIGMTLGLVWVPCAGPALGFVFAILRSSPTTDAALALLAYALGTAVPLLLVGYGGQRAVHSVRSIAPYTGRIKQCAGALLMITAVGLHLHWFEKAQIWLLDHTNLGDIGTQLEDRFFGETFENAQRALYSSFASAARVSSISSMPTPDGDLPSLPQISRAPEFVGLGEWFNSTPLTMAELKGKVVLVDFWTYSCINCIRTLPFIKRYWATYKDTGKFVLLGVHAPEFVFERSPESVQEAIERHGLTYPIAQDNRFQTWSAFANHYWPAKYLIDAEGYIRYTHFGEGDYDETDRAIRSLLAEAGVDLDMANAVPEESQGRRKALTSETYLGERSLQAYVDPSINPLPLHHYTLVGDWGLVDSERRVLRGDRGEIRMRFLGGEINLVLGGQGKATVLIDGNEVKTFVIDHHDLYSLFTGLYGEHEMILKIEGAGVEAYAFTFGAGE